MHQCTPPHSMFVTHPIVLALVEACDACHARCNSTVSLSLYAQVSCGLG